MPANMLRRGRRLARFGKPYTPPPCYWRWTRTLNAAHRCFCVICRDGSLSFCLFRLPDGEPMPTREECDTMARTYRSSVAGKSRIPPCPPFPPMRR
jgi:hypothetical protein